MATTSGREGHAMTLTLCVLAVLTGVALGGKRGAKRGANQPNIVVVLLDDAGWGDFETNDPEMRTPNIRAIGEEGLFLNSSYILPMCAPSRTALITGRHPHTMGAQTGKAAGTNKLFWPGIYNNETVRFVSDELKDLGYRTHALGKWHLGLCHPSLTPLGRGFDTFHGMLLGAHSSYWTHKKGNGANSPYDWYDGLDVDQDAAGTYNTDLINADLVKIVEESDPAQPFFVYAAYPAPHGPFEAPQNYLDRCAHVEDSARQVHCAMVAAVDDGVGMLRDALKAKGIYDDTAILVLSDNGGPVGAVEEGYTASGASNWPLRGGKKTVFEGGTRVFTALKAPGLQVTNATYNGLVHAVDWMPAFVAMAGGDTKDWMHGESNTWSRIKRFVDNRKEMLYTIDDYYKFNHSAYRFENYKIIIGKPGFDLGWYPPPNLVESGEAETEDVDGTIFKKNPGIVQLFDLSVDPTERNDLALLLEDPAYKGTQARTDARKALKKVLGKYEAFMAKYPLMPHRESASDDNWKQDGYINTCFCQPSDAASCQDTEDQIRSRQ